MQDPYQYDPTTGAPGGGGISQRTAMIMARTKGWVRFIGIVFLIFGALMVIPMFVAFSDGRPSQVGSGVFLLAASILMMIIPGLKLNGYANRIGTLLQTGMASDLEAALNEHRGYWKFVGILQLIGLGLLAIAFLISIVS